MKLVQKQIFQGIREFEIIDTLVHSRTRILFKEKALTAELSMINPEPVVNEPFLEFHGRVKNEPLLSLWIGNPSAQEFNAFVDELKQRARQEYNAFAGLKAGSLPEGMARNVFEEPPEFDEPGQNRLEKTLKPVNVESIDNSLQMLRLYLEAGDIQAFLNALETLKAEPGNKSYFRALVTAFDELGPRQGAVLTYAPYVGVLLSDDPFESR